MGYIFLCVGAGLRVFDFHRERPNVPCPAGTIEQIRGLSRRPSPEYVTLCHYGTHGLDLPAAIERDNQGRSTVPKIHDDVYSGQALADAVTEGFHRVGKVRCRKPVADPLVRALKIFPSLAVLNLNSHVLPDFYHKRRHAGL
jgi:hypothetical protein